MSDEIPKFGDYLHIEMHRYGSDNEIYLHKCIGQESTSNSYVPVPVVSNPKEVRHDEMVPVVRAVCCGLDERRIFKYALSDVKVVSKPNATISSLFKLNTKS